MAIPDLQARGERDAARPAVATTRGRPEEQHTAGRKLCRGVETPSVRIPANRQQRISPLAPSRVPEAILMSQYIDGYVLPVPTDKIDEYRDMAAEAGESWIRHGALQYVECLGDDLDPDMGDVEITTFPDLVAADEDESVIFAFVVYESRTHRDEVNAAVMAEMEAMADTDEIEMPFDVARMAYGGFETLVEYYAASSDEEPIGTTG